MDVDPLAKRMLLALTDISKSHSTSSTCPTTSSISGTPSAATTSTLAHRHPTISASTCTSLISSASRGAATFGLAQPSAPVKAHHTETALPASLNPAPCQQQARPVLGYKMHTLSSYHLHSQCKRTYEEHISTQLKFVFKISLAVVVPYLSVLLSSWRSSYLARDRLAVQQITVAANSASQPAPVGPKAAKSCLPGLLSQL